MQVKEIAPLIVILAGLAVLPHSAASETSEFSDGAAVLRAGLEKFAHLQELCARQSDHADCSPAGWMLVCDELGETPVRADAGQVSATSTEPSLLLHVSDLMHRAACFEPAASAESPEHRTEHSVVRVARRSPRHLEAADAAFGVWLREESSGLRSRLSEVFHSVRFLEKVNEAAKMEFLDLEGEPLDAEASGLPDLASAVAALEQECGEDCSDEARTSACTKLDPLVKKTASSLEATLRLSDRSRYHFVNERVSQAEMLRHLFIAGNTQRRLCGRDSEAHAWRDDYLRYEAEAVRLIDPRLGATLARYFANRFDVDFRKGL